mmetsp:Transcript_17505/g.35994  ORF Transcript_17505/g.35994 Transcript_17505/m.35994 type:complete len:108 (-) Transcript_17505:38-361(-)
MGERIVYSFSLSKTFDAMDGIVLVFVVELWPMKRMTLQEKGKKKELFENSALEGLPVLVLVGIDFCNSCVEEEVVKQFLLRAQGEHVRMICAKGISVLWLLRRKNRE